VRSDDGTSARAGSNGNGRADTILDDTASESPYIQPHAVTMPPLRNAEPDFLQLLGECFNSDELRWFLQDGPNGGVLAHGLPTGSPSMDLLVREAVRVLERHALIDAALFRRLLSTRPARHPQILRVAASHGVLLAEPPAGDIDLLRLLEQQQDTTVVQALLTATAALSYSHPLREQVHVFAAMLRSCRNASTPNAIDQIFASLRRLTTQVAELDFAAPDLTRTEDVGARALHDEITASIRDDDIPRAATRLLDMAKAVGAPRTRIDDLAALRERVEHSRGTAEPQPRVDSGKWLSAVHEVLDHADQLRGLAAVSSPHVSLSEARHQFSTKRGISGDASEIAVACHDITKSYPDIADRTSPFMLSGVSLRLTVGTITGVFGANGSGKTTLLRILAGQLAPTRGHVEYPWSPGRTGLRIDWATVRQRVVHVEQRPPRWYGRLADELHRWVGLHGVFGEQNAAEVEFYLHRLDLYQYREARWPSLSEGYRMRFELARALLARPKLLVLDEPLAPLDITAHQRFLRDVRDLAAAAHDPVAVILSSQHIPEVEAIANNVLCLTGGRVRYFGTCEQLAATSDCHVIEFDGHVPSTIVDSFRPAFGLRDARRWSDCWILRIPRSVPLPVFARAAFEAHPKLGHFRDITGSCTKFFRGE